MNQLIKVEVIEIRPSGVLVKLPDGKLGFIRRRELSWDRSIRSAPNFPAVGQYIDVVMVKGKPADQYLELSLRRHTNPWRDAPRKYSLDQVIDGEVVGIRNFGVFVQIEPGVEAIIWPRDLPISNNASISSILGLGDHVRAMITKIDYDDRTMELSVVKYLTKLYNSIEDGSIESQLQRDFELVDPTQAVATPASDIKHTNEIRGRWQAPILPNLEKILIIDDERNELQKIGDHLRSVFRIQTDCVETGIEGLALLKKRHHDLAIIDVRLANEAGVEIAKMLLEHKPDLEIIFISFDPLAEHEIEAMFGKKYPFALKDLEIIAAHVDNMHRGFFDVPKRNESVQDTNHFVDQLGMTAYANIPLSHRLEELLRQLKKETGVEYVILVEMDLLNKTAVMLASSPEFAEPLKSRLADGLYFSPARDIIENQTPIYETDIRTNRPTRLKNLFPLLDFHTYYGVPISFPGLAPRYILFVLDEDRAFDSDVMDQVKMTGRILEVVLEKQLLLGYMERYEKRYLLGLLFGSLVHELKTKLDGLSGFSQSLLASLRNQNNKLVSNSADPFLNLIDLSKNVENTRIEIVDLVNAYTLLAKGELEAVDINRVLQKVQRLLNKAASEVGVRIALHVDPDMAMASGISSSLEQVISNLVLNSIQQIEKKNKMLAQFSAQSNEFHLRRKMGLVVIRARYVKSNAVFPIQIAVLDTGPGIHYQDHENIFMLDVSTRKIGQGLGLFISRRLTESMGGRLCLFHSAIPYGSTFLVELATV